MKNPWHSLEMIGGYPAFPAMWQSYAGAQYAALKTLCLRVSAYEPQSYPCPRDCGCWHRIVRNQDRTAAVATCCCKPSTCPDFPLTIEDITPLEVNPAKLGRALCQALLLHTRFADFPLNMTWQIGSWSADAASAIFTIQSDPYDLRTVIAELGLRLQRPYILLAPTSDLLNAKSQELLAHAKAAFFPLDTTVILTDHGTLLPAKTPGELFAQFNPQPKDSIAENVARQTVALAKALDSEQPFRKAPVYSVFLLYCVEGLPVNEVAKKCRCVRSVVFTRLKLLRQKFGRNPSELRQYSAQFERIEASLSDPRARSIYRQGAAYGHQAQESEE